MTPTADGRRSTDCSAGKPLVVDWSVTSRVALPPYTCVPAGNVTLPETPANAGSGTACALFAFDASADDDVAQGTEHAGTGLAVGIGIGVGPGGVDEPPPPPPPPHAASIGTNVDTKTTKSVRRVRNRTAPHPEENDIAPVVHVRAWHAPPSPC